MKADSLKFNLLHNFISPVTGRILARTNYVPYGDKLGIATPSPIIIDIRLEIRNLRKLVDSIIDGTIILPIGSLPNLPYQNIWIGDITNRPVPNQRIGLINLPPFFTGVLSPFGPLQNYGVYNLYTGQGLIPNPLNITEPTTTLRIDDSNMANLTVGKMWIGIANSTPPITVIPTPPFIEITGDLNWDLRVALPPPIGGLEYGVPNEIGLDPNYIFIGSTDPLKLGQIETSDILITIQNDITTIQNDITTIQREIGGIQNEILIIQRAILLINGEILTINTTLYTPIVGLVSQVATIDATLYTPVIGLVFVVAGLVITVGNIYSTLIGGSAGQVLTSLGTSSLPIWTTISSGTVTSVTGTAGQIVVINNTTTPIISIDPTYVGQTSITTLGTITTGTWNGNVITVPYGGTGDSSFTAYTLIAGGTTTTGSLQSLTAGISGQVLTSNGVGALPTWSTLSTGVTSITGTANQITASSATGAVTLSMPANVIITTSVTAGNLELVTNTLQSNNTNGNILIEPNGTGNVGIGFGTPIYLLDVFGTTRVVRFLGNGNAPSVTLGTTSVVGTGATSSIGGSEVGGTFSLTTGTGITLTAGVVATFTLVSAMPSSTFSVVFSPSSSNIQSVYITSISSTQFTLNTIASSVLLPNTTYSWNYHIIGY